MACGNLHLFELPIAISVFGLRVRFLEGLYGMGIGHILVAVLFDDYGLSRQN